MNKRRLVIESVLVILAIAARAATVLILQSHTVPHSSYEHGEIAANLLAGRGFSMHFLGSDGPTSQQAPIYPIIVAFAYAIGGVDSPKSLLILELSQSILGGLLVLGMLKLCRGIAPLAPYLGWIAGLIVALHPTLVYAATHVQVALLGTTLLIWVLVWAYQTGATGRHQDAMRTGCLLALLALTDPILSLVVVGVISAVWLGRENAATICRAAWWLVAIALFTATVAISPWLIRNALVHKEFVAIKSTFGYAFWQGNCALSEGTDKVVRSSVEKTLARGATTSTFGELNRTIWEARHEAGYLDDIALSQADRRWLGRFSEPERSRILFRRAVRELRADPSRYFRMCLRRLRYFLLFDETNPKTRVLAYRLPHLGLTMLGASGLVLAGPLLRRRLVPTMLTALAIAVFHTLTIVSARFHIPVEPLLAVWGAAGLSRFSPAPRYNVERVRIVHRLRVGMGIRGPILHRTNVHAGQK